MNVCVRDKKMLPSICFFFFMLIENILFIASTKIFEDSYNAWEGLTYFKANHENIFKNPMGFAKAKSILNIGSSQIPEKILNDLETYLTIPSNCDEHKVNEATKAIRLFACLGNTYNSSFAHHWTCPSEHYLIMRPVPIFNILLCILSYLKLIVNFFK